MNEPLPVSVVGGSQLERLRQMLRSWVHLPQDPLLLEAHAQTVLLRTWVAAWIAAFIIPFTIFVYVGMVLPRAMPLAIGITVLAELGIAWVLWAIGRPFLQRNYHIPFFILVGVVCDVTETVLIQITGGAAKSDFLFPYFLVLFGIATLFPARFSWVVAASLMAPATYLVGELWVAGELAVGEPWSDLILLVDAAFIASIANRVTTRLFFSEVENRNGLVQANAKLREQDKLKSEFFANLSHDLRSPLTIVLGPLSSMAAEANKLEPYHRRLLEFALSGASRLDGMVNDLLELARIDAGVGELSTSPFDLRAALTDLVQAAQAMATSQGQTVSLEAPPNKVPVDLDSSKIDRVAMNLISNACKFSPPNTAITVKLSSDSSGVLIEVKDQGPGIAPGEHERVFERFIRGKSGGKGRAKGVGLGLAVVKEFVELHGGKVSLESEAGKGCTFRVWLPPSCRRTDAELCGAERVVRTRSADFMMRSVEVPKAQPAPVRRPKLLLVEDTDELREFIAADLRRVFDVVEAETGEDAIDLVMDGRPDAVLLDVMLPEADGYEVCRKLRHTQGTKDVPILMFSARADMQTRMNAFAAGADDFLHKPFEMRELRVRLAALLRRSGVAAAAEQLTPSEGNLVADRLRS